MKDHKGSINSLDCHKFFWKISLITKFTCSKFNTIFIKKLHVQNTQTSRVDNPFFFKCHFLKPNMHHSF